jgi:hypothetical protein
MAMPELLARIQAIARGHERGRLVGGWLGD